MLTSIVGPLLALLPKRWRNELFSNLEINWPRATAISGALEGAGGFLALIAWYLYFIRKAAKQQAQTILEAMGKTDVPQDLTDVGASYSMGLASLVDLVMQPLTWVLAYCAVEGTLRAFAAVVNEESPGSGPLVLLERLIRGGRQRAWEARVPLVADVVTRGGAQDPWDLKVESCRPKSDWKFPKTIGYEDEFFQVAGEAAVGGTLARPNVYLLRRVPTGEAHRGFEAYDPEAVTRPEAAAPGFFASVFGMARESYRLRRLPLVADRVTLGDGAQGWHLQVESCRLKPEWTYPRTIRYEDQLYRVEGSYQAQPPRPFGYRLRRLPEGEAVRGVLPYSPDTPLRQG